jgi:hypothetical protein
MQQCTPNIFGTSLDTVYEESEDFGLRNQPLSNLVECAERKDIYVNNQHSLEEHSRILGLKAADRIQQLQCMCKNIFSQCETCLEVEVHHFETAIK